MKSAQHRICGGIFTPNLDIPPDHNGRKTCICRLIGEAGDAHHTVPDAPAADAQSLAAGERGEP